MAERTRRESADEVKVLRPSELESLKGGAPPGPNATPELVPPVTERTPAEHDPRHERG